MKRTARAKEFERAWFDYCVTNRIIAYGEVPSLTEEQIEARCKAQFEKDCEEIRRKYESVDYKPRVLSERRGT